MSQACTTSPSAAAGTGLPPAGCLLQVRPTRRPYPLLETVRHSPLLRSDIGRGSPGVPLRLGVELRDAQARPIPNAVVYIWHRHQRARSIDFQGSERDAVTRLRGVQVSDAAGSVHFQTVYPGRDRDGSVPVYLQIYLNDAQQVTARCGVCVLLPHQTGGPLRGIAPALPVTGCTERPHVNAAGDAAVLTLGRLDFDAERGSLQGRLRINLEF